MMMGSSVLTTTTVSEALTLINVMLDPQQAKRILTELAAETTRHEEARATAVEEQQRASRDRADADKRITQAEAAASAIRAREEAVTAREQQADRVRALVREKLAAAEA
jgi:hypothetical protein